MPPGGTRIAKGMIAEYAGTGIGEAARLLADYVGEHHLRLTETAYALVTRTVAPAAVVEAQPRA